MLGSNGFFALPTLAAALMVSGCGDADLPADEQDAAALDSTSASGSAISEATEDAAARDGFSNDDAQASTMPGAMRGRWGLVAADCTSERGDAKGLIAIDNDSIKFYESRAVIASVSDRGEDSISGQFDFTGEGQEWTLDMVWTLGADGETLVRRESGADAAPDPLEYRKCD